MPAVETRALNAFSSVSATFTRRDLCRIAWKIHMVSPSVAGRQPFLKLWHVIGLGGANCGCDSMAPPG